MMKIEGPPQIYTEVRNPAASPAPAKTFKQVMQMSTQDHYVSSASPVQVEQAAKVPDLPNFSKMTDRQKLSALATLHNATDYSGMTDVERYKLINDRFEAAFPNLQAYNAGLYGPSIICFENPVDQANHRKTIPERIYDEQHRQYSVLENRKVIKLHKEAYYSGMSKEETIAAVVKRHSGGTMAARAATLWEIDNLGLGDRYAIEHAMDAMRTAVCVVATGSEHFPPLGSYSEGQYRAALSYATGTKVSWAEVKKMAQAFAAEFGGQLCETAGKTVQEVIDELFDHLTDAEKPESNEASFTGGRHAFSE